MLPVDNTQKVSYGVGRQPGSDRGEQVESMVSIGQLGVAHRQGDVIGQVVFERARREAHTLQPGFFELERV